MESRNADKAPSGARTAPGGRSTTGLATGVDADAYRAARLRRRALAQLAQPIRNARRVPAFQGGAWEGLGPRRQSRRALWRPTYVAPGTEVTVGQTVSAVSIEATDRTGEADEGCVLSHS